ncbi:MAG: endolytic transglycosylase MltG [Bacteroidales bacterium]|nr:endolytic transglycosylase MltG [Bacteroidales bacterium]
MIKIKKKSVVLLLVLLLAGIALAITAWCYVFKSNTTLSSPSGNYYLHIPHGADYDDVIALLEQEKLLKNKNSFSCIAHIKKYPEHIKPGRYLITPGMSNYYLINMLRSGSQEPVRVIFNNANRMEDIARKITPYFFFDSVMFMQTVTDEGFLDSMEVSSDMLIAWFLPNTYEFWWTDSPFEVVSRMKREYKKFWTPARREQAASMGMTPEEVMVLASVVQKETNHPEEMSRMAGVLVNRLAKGWKLQADPTVKYAWGDFSLTRILYRHLEHPSPYNTYAHHGLPPGPICAVEPYVVDKVLDYEQHEYMFYCAKPGINAMHAFAKTNAQHEQNSRIYQRWFRETQR